MGARRFHVSYVIHSGRNPQKNTVERQLLGVVNRRLCFDAKGAKSEVALPKITPWFSANELPVTNVTIKRFALSRRESPISLFPPLRYTFFEGYFVTCFT